MASGSPSARRQYIVELRAGIIGAIIAGLATLAGRLFELPVWALAVIFTSVVLGVIILRRPQIRRQRRLAGVLQDPSSSGSAFKLVAFLEAQLIDGRPPDEILTDVNLATKLRHFPNDLLVEPFRGPLSAETLTSSERSKLVRWANLIQRETPIARERVIRNTASFLTASLRATDLVVLYGYSSTVCEGIIRARNLEMIVLVIEDLQYGPDSVQEHLIVERVLSAADVVCHILPFSELDHLLQSSVTATLTIAGQRISLSRRRTLIGILGFDAVDFEGKALVPAVIAGVPSDSACLAEAFADGNGSGDRAASRLIFVGESYKVAPPETIVDARTSAPLRPPRWLRALHSVGLAVPFQAAEARLFRIESGITAIITDAGVHDMDTGTGLTLRDARAHWRASLASSSGSDIPPFAETESSDVTPDEPESGNPGPVMPVLVRGVIFDWNGVLALDEPLHYAAFSRLCVELTARTLSHTSYSTLCLGLTDEEGSENLRSAGLVGGEIEEIVRRKREIYAQLASGDAHIFASGGRALLQDLQARGVPFRIVTASASSEVNAIRSAAGMDDLIPNEMVSSNVGRNDRREALSVALAEMAVQGSVLLIDDSEHNIEIGNDLGLVTLRIADSAEEGRTSARFSVRCIEDITTSMVEFGGMQ